MFEGKKHCSQYTSNGKPGNTLPICNKVLGSICCLIKLKGMSATDDCFLLCDTCKYVLC